jgi:hypothetical protein
MRQIDFSVVEFRRASNHDEKKECDSNVRSAVTEATKESENLLKELMKPDWCIGMKGVHMSEPEQESKPTPHQMTKEEFDLLTSQGISPITGERLQSAAEIAKQKEQQSKHEFRVFLFLGVPVGLVLAFVIALPTNMGNTGFFCTWAVCTMISGAILSSIIGARKPNE